LVFRNSVGGVVTGRSGGKSRLADEAGQTDQILKQVKN
jgi:hypothetical protein